MKSLKLPQDSNVSLKCAALELWLVRCELGAGYDGERAIGSLIVRHLKGLARSSGVSYTPAGLQLLTVLSKGMRTLTRDRVGLSFDVHALRVLVRSMCSRGICRTT